MLTRSASLSLAAIAEKVAGRLVGPPDLVIEGLCAIDDQRPGHVTFLNSRSSLALKRQLASLSCAAALVPARIFDKLDAAPGCPVIAVADPFAAMVSLVPEFYRDLEPPPGVHPTAVVSPTARIGPDAVVGPHCIVGDGAEVGAGAVLHARVTLYPEASVGRRTQIHAGAVVRERCTIGDDCIVHANAVIGADGFGFRPDPQLGLAKVPQVGRVVIGDRVEIGANACIDRGALGDTRVGRGTKIDNLVQVGHNTVIGEHCILCGQVGVAGSTKIGDRVVLGGGAGVADHITIASDIRVGALAGVHTSLDAPGDYAGFPVQPAREWRRTFAAQLKATREDKGPAHGDDT